MIERIKAKEAQDAALAAEADQAVSEVLAAQESNAQ